SATAPRPACLTFIATGGTSAMANTVESPNASGNPASDPASAASTGAGARTHVECGCAAGEGATDGRKAVGVDPDIKERNLKRLRRIEGQVRGLQKMVDDD